MLATVRRLRQSDKALTLEWTDGSGGGGGGGRERRSTAPSPAGADGGGATTPATSRHTSRHHAHLRHLPQVSHHGAATPDWVTQSFVLPSRREADVWLRGLSVLVPLSALSSGLRSRVRALAGASSPRASPRRSSRGSFTGSAFGATAAAAAAPPPPPPPSPPSPQTATLVGGADGDSAPSLAYRPQLTDLWRGKPLSAYRRVRQFVLLHSIGRGSFGSVKLALSQADGRFYAIKVLSKVMLRKTQRLRALEQGGGVPRRIPARRG